MRPNPDLKGAFDAPVIVAVLAGALLLASARPLPAQQAITLQQAIAMAQERGEPARSAAATLDAARYRDQSFYSLRLPQLSLGGTVPSYNRSIIQVVQPDGSTLFLPQDQLNAGLTATLTQSLPWTGGDLFFSSSLAQLSVTGQQTVRTWSSTPFSIGLRQPLFRANAARWDRREQPVRLELAERQYREAREDIAIQTTNLFFDLYATRVQLANATTNAAVNDTLYTLNKGRFEVGKIGENDLLQSELALLRARNLADGARLDHQRARSALCLALGLPPDALLEILVVADLPTFVADTTLAVTEALRNRAAVSDAELQEIQTRRRVTEAKLNGGLGATVQASYGFNATGPQANAAYHNLQEARQFSVSVNIPVVQWGARSENVQAAEADRERAASIARATLDQTALDAHFAALQLEQARRTLAISAKADTVAGRRFEVAYNRYVIGRIAIDNLFVAQAEKDQALAQYVQALRGYWVAHYRLRRVTLFDFEAGKELR
jgi:outer membrane protein TolC